MVRSGHRLFGKPGSLKRGQITFVWAVFIPIVFLFLAIRVFPIISNLSLSLTNAHLIRPVTKFVGLRNFLILFSDKQFLRAFFNSLEFVAIAVPGEIVLSLIFALLLSRKVRGKNIRGEGFFKTLYFIPYILPMVPAIIIWRFFFSPGDFGLANYLLSSLGIPKVSWMSNSRILLLTIIGIHIWKNLGFYLVVFLVALKAVPRDIIDAARIDGARGLQIITRIELPLIKPTLLFGIVLATLIAWSAFTEVYTMCQGSDVSSGSEIQVLMLRMYQEVFTYSNTGKGSAISMVIFIISVVFILIEFRIFKERKVQHT